MLLTLHINEAQNTKKYTDFTPASQVVAGDIFADFLPQKNQWRIFFNKK